jgi:hypothetical protein
VKGEPAPAETAARILRAKAAELEAWLQNAETPEPIDHLAADVALIAELLAAVIERGPS